MIRKTLFIFLLNYLPISLKFGVKVRQLLSSLSVASKDTTPVVEAIVALISQVLVFAQSFKATLASAFHASSVSSVVVSVASTAPVYVKLVVTPFVPGVS